MSRRKVYLLLLSMCALLACNLISTCAGNPYYALNALACVGLTIMIEFTLEEE